MTLEFWNAPFWALCQNTLIAKRFNHSDPKTTMLYLGIEDKEVHRALMNEIG